MTAQEILKCISIVYQKKCEADVADDAAGFEHETLVEVLQEHFIQLHGLKSTATKQIAQLVAGIKKFQEHDLRIYRFGTLIGVLESPNCNLQSADVYLSYLLSFCPIGSITQWYDRPPSFITRSMVDKMVQQSHRMDIPAPLVKEFETTLSEQEDGLLHLDQVLEAGLKLWFAYQTQIDRELFALFESADENQDGVLSFDEFVSMVRIRMPDYDERVLMRMFKSCGEENDSGEHEIKPSEFALVMRTYQNKLSHKLIKC